MKIIDIEILLYITNINKEKLLQLFVSGIEIAAMTGRSAGLCTTVNTTTDHLGPEVLLAPTLPLGIKGRAFPGSGSYEDSPGIRECLLPSPNSQVRCEEPAAAVVRWHICTHAPPLHSPFNTLVPVGAEDLCIHLPSTSGTALRRHLVGQLEGLGTESGEKV